MSNAELLKELKENFEKMKSELGFESSFEDVDRIFFIQDHILSEGFVSKTLERQICSRITDLYMAWNNYLHSLIMPNPQNMLNMGESNIFDADEKREITELMKKAMELSSRNSLIGLTRDAKEIGKFVDDAVNFWDDIFSVKMRDIMKKINKEWKEEVE